MEKDGAYRFIRVVRLCMLFVAIIAVKQLLGLRAGKWSKE